MSNPLKQALDSGYEIQQVFTRTGQKYYNIVAVQETEDGTFRVTYRYRTDPYSVFLAPDEVSHVTAVEL